jgi:hypothetical protein
MSELLEDHEGGQAAHAAAVEGEQAQVVAGHAIVGSGVQVQVLSVLSQKVEVFWCLCPWSLSWIAQLRQPFGPQRVRLSQLNGRLNVVDGYGKGLTAAASCSASAAVV